MEVVQKLDFVENKTTVRIAIVSFNDPFEVLSGELFRVANKSWISELDTLSKKSYTARARETVEYLRELFKSGEISEKTGEYIVSFLLREVLGVKYNHDNKIPIGEFIKEKKLVNHGFDVFTITSSDFVCFGEAKYSSSRNPFDIGLKQVNDFIDEEKHLKDLLDIKSFLSPQVIENSEFEEFAFSCGFSQQDPNQKNILKNIKKNLNLQKLILRNYEEIVLIGVSI